MSREIRFRFWDTEEGKWLGKESSYWKELTFEDCRKKLIASMRQGNIVAEQYTGLTDKKGKEIYEGDILGGIFEGCYIGWCDITKSFELFNCYERYCMACDGDILWCELSDSDIDLEVIGNVHENPELLGGEE